MRWIRLALTLIVGATTLLVARPAEAAGDTYLWVATAAGNFTNPANWEPCLRRQRPGCRGPETSPRSSTRLEP